MSAKGLGNDEQRIDAILNGNIYKVFLILALPGFMMIVIQALLPIFDSYLIYKYDDKVSGAAISYVASLQNIFIMGCYGLSSAGSAIIGQLNGNKDVSGAKKMSSQLISFLTIGSLIAIPVIIIAGLIVGNGIDNPELRQRVITYNTYLVFSLPFIFFQRAYINVKGVFGYPIKGFYMVLFFVPLKLMFTFLFVGILKLGIKGAAFSTIVAYFCTFVYGFWDLYVKKSEGKLYIKDCKLEKKVAKNIFRRGWPAVIQNSLKSLSFFLMKAEVEKYGVKAMNANGIAGDINNLYQQLTASFETAIISFVSINAGAGNGERAKKAAYFAVKAGIVISVILTFVSIFFTPYLIRAYTDDPEIISMALKANRIFTAGFIGFSVLFNEMPTFVALGKNVESMVIQFIRIWGLRYLALYSLYFFYKDIGVYAVFYSLTIANLLGAMVSHYVFKRINWNKIS